MLQLNINNVPFKTLNRLEVVLIAKRLLFNKIAIIPDTWKSLPKGGRSSEVNLQTLMFKEHFFFQLTSLKKIFEALRHLKGNDKLYRYIKINMINICSY